MAKKGGPFSHWTRRNLDDLDSDELAGIADVHGIDHEARELTWEEVVDELLAIQDTE